MTIGLTEYHLLSYFASGSTSPRRVPGLRWEFQIGYWVVGYAISESREKEIIHELLQEIVQELKRC